MVPVDFDIAVALQEVFAQHPPKAIKVPDRIGDLNYVLIDLRKSSVQMIAAALKNDREVENGEVRWAELSTLLSILYSVDTVPSMR